MAGCPIQDRGFRFGMHVFETIRVMAGQPAFWARHWELLEQAAKATGWGGAPGEMPPPPELPAVPGVLRLYWTAGDGSPFGEPAAGRLLAAFQPTEVGRKAPIRAGQCEQPLRGDWAGLKTGQYGERVALLGLIRLAGLDEGLVWFEDGTVSGWCLANLLVKSQGAWWTPSSERIREGTTLRWVREVASVKAGAIDRTDLLEAEALGLCNAVQGIIPVVALDDIEYPADPELQQWAAAFDRATRP